VAADLNACETCSECAVKDEAPSNGTLWSFSKFLGDLTLFVRWNWSSVLAGELELATRVWMVFSRLASRSLTPLTSCSLHKVLVHQRIARQCISQRNELTSQRKSRFASFSQAVLSRSYSGLARKDRMSRAPCDRI